MIVLVDWLVQHLLDSIWLLMNLLLSICLIACLLGHILICLQDKNTFEKLKKSWSGCCEYYYGISI
jgi:hypothetical protein